MMSALDYMTAQLRTENDQLRRLLEDRALEISTLRRQFVHAQGTATGLANRVAELEAEADRHRHAATAARDDAKIARGVSSACMRKIAEQTVRIEQLEWQLDAALHSQVVIDATCVDADAAQDGAW